MMWKKTQPLSGLDRPVLGVAPEDGPLMEAHGDSMIGLQRTINEDRWFIMPFTPHAPDGADLDSSVRATGYLVGVADGIGGAPAGERASLIVAGTLKRFIRQESTHLLRTDRTDGETTETLNRGLRKCQAALAEKMNQHPEYWGMGTTLTAAVVLWPRIYLFHLGDSSAYLLRDGTLRKLTLDQTYARSLMDAGILSERSEHRSRWKHVLWNFLGGRASGLGSEVHPEVYIEDLRRKDILIFCSDGLNHVLTDSDIQDLLAKGGSPKELSDSLIHSARKRGAKDDTTVVIARFDESQIRPKVQ